MPDTGSWGHRCHVITDNSPVNGWWANAPHGLQHVQCRVSEQTELSAGLPYCKLPQGLSSHPLADVADLNRDHGEGVYTQTGVILKYLPVWIGTFLHKQYKTQTTLKRSPAFGPALG